MNLKGCSIVDEKILYSSFQNISTQTSLTDLTLSFDEKNILNNFISLGNLHQLKNLNLNFGSLANGNISLISKAFSCLKNLESFGLYIYRSNESDKRAYCLADALTSLTNLKSLTLTFHLATFLTDNFCNYFKEPLSKLQELEYLELYFPNSQTTDQGIVEIASTLISLRKLISLKLNFYHCQNKDKSLEAIGNAILKMSQIRLLSLIFSRSMVTSQGILFIDRTISKLHALKDISLKFSHCENIEDYSVKRLCESMKGLKQLQSLYVDFEGSTKNEFEKEVVDSLKNSLPFLKSFSFLTTNIYPEVIHM